MTDDTPVSKVEGIKVTSDYLRGTIAEELAGDAPVFSNDSYELLKFHGIYQQDDRSVRAERKRQGLGVDHICMVRVSIPGGTLDAEQFLRPPSCGGRVAHSGQFFYDILARIPVAHQEDALVVNFCPDDLSGQTQANARLTKKPVLSKTGIHAGFR